ncbi:MAG: transposase [Patescibacteria group bacterium]
MLQVWYLDEIRGLERKNRKQKKAIEDLRQQNEKLKNENADLKNQLKEMAEQKKAKKAWFRQNYSLSNHEKQNDGTGKKRSPGRIPKEKKLGNVQEECHVYPEHVAAETCIISHTRYVTHLKDGKKHVVLYHIYKTPWGDAPKLPGVMPRGEYGMEVAVILAFLVYFIQISIDQARSILVFFTGIDLSRSQADSLLQQLGTLLEPELEKIIDLLALAYLVHIDETGWKIGKERLYAWIFTNLAHTVLLYGKSRGEETIEEVLSRAFEGTVVTDFFSAYEKYFKGQQKCWAHLLRTMIRLMLQHPDKKEYKTFFDALHALFVAAKRTQKEDSLTEVQRRRKAATLQGKLRKLCARHKEKIPAGACDDLRDFLNVQKRMIKYLDSLFTFVLHPEVEPTNNRAEQGFRKTAKARNNYQTSKTKRGAQRRSVLASVLTSLRQNLPEFSLNTVVAEVRKWRIDGASLFDRQLQAAQARASPE